jgi:subtilisin family serine protease
MLKRFRMILVVYGLACFSGLFLAGSALVLTSGPEARFKAAGDALSADVGGSFVPDQVVVQYRRIADATDKSQTRQRVDATVADRSEYKPNLQLLSLNGSTSVQEAVRDLESDQAVEFAEPNFVRELAATPNDPYFPRMWGLHNIGQSLLVPFPGGTPDADIDAPEAWDTETGSLGVTVAVLDTGIDFQHPDLRDNIWTNPGEVGSDQFGADKRSNGVDDDSNGYKDDWRGWDFGASDNNPAVEYYSHTTPPMDVGSHGVYVAGTIGAEGNDGYGVTGVAWKVSLMGVKMYATGGSWKAAEAFRYASANGADIANGSFAGPTYSEVERSALEQSPNTLFVFAAGNWGTDNDQTPYYPCNYPLVNAICVAATDKDDKLASISNYGASTVDLAAPGVDIVSTKATYQGGGWIFSTGTSMASPMVAGAAAVLLARRPEASVAAVRAALLDGVDQKQLLQAKVVSGGRLNLDKSLDLIQGGGAPANDEFADAVQLGGADVARSDDTNVGATKEAGEPNHAGNQGGASIWYRWDAPASGMVIVDTLGSDFDTTLAVYTGNAVDGLKEVASNDDAGSQAQSKISFEATTNTTYRIAVDGHNYGFGHGATTDKVDLHLAMEDVTPPDTMIDSGPTGTIATNQASFTFSGNPASDTAKVQCRVDEQAFVDCTSPKSFSSLAEGPHTVAFRAEDAAGNQDPSPITRSFSVDTIPPNTTINTGPTGVITTNQATFTFTGDPAGDTAKFQCQIDSEPFADCTSPKTFSALTEGTHTARFRAEDAAGNQDQTPAYSIIAFYAAFYKARIGKVTVKGPASARRGKTATYSAKIANSGNAEAKGVRLKVSGRGVGFDALVGKVAAGKTRTVKVKLKPRKTGKVKVTFKVTSSNAGSKTVKKTVTVGK